VLPVLFVLVCGIITGGMAVFHHQQVACLAREGARWASVRGAPSQTDTGLPPPARDQIVARAILPLAVGMDPAGLAVTVEWVDNGTNTVTDWDAATKDFRSVTATGEYVTNAVRVTVTYQCGPGVFGSTLTVRSVTERPMSN
ncbi:MAG TPA: TadE family protein, partial [Urbifossiella sp.]|nr:TadE family protein [Urbifossiella sp.]